MIKEDAITCVILDEKDKESTRKQVESALHDCGFEISGRGGDDTQSEEDLPTVVRGEKLIDGKELQISFPVDPTRITEGGREYCIYQIIVGIETNLGRSADLFEEISRLFKEICENLGPHIAHFGHKFSPAGNPKNIESGVPSIAPMSYYSHKLMEDTDIPDTTSLDIFEVDKLPDGVYIRPNEAYRPKRTENVRRAEETLGVEFRD